MHGRIIDKLGKQDEGFSTMCLYPIQSCHVQVRLPVVPAVRNGVLLVLVGDVTHLAFSSIEISICSDHFQIQTVCTISAFCEPYLTDYKTGGESCAMLVYIDNLEGRNY